MATQATIMKSTSQAKCGLHMPLGNQWSDTMSSIDGSDRNLSDNKNTSSMFKLEIQLQYLGFHLLQIWAPSKEPVW